LIKIMGRVEAKFRSRNIRLSCSVLDASLQEWCDQYLDATQWTQLQAVIRAARREAGQTRTVRLSTSAYTRLHDLAVREQLTLSETIERCLADGTTATTRQAHATPPRAEKTPVEPTAARTGASERAHPAVAPQKRSPAFITTRKGVCYLTIKIGRENFALRRIRNYTIDAQDKRDMRRLHPDVDFDWKKITRQLDTVAEILNSIWTVQVIVFILPVRTFFPRRARLHWI
jgi:hypothetical protein